MEQEIFYFIMVDRFCQGDKDKSFDDLDKNHPRKFHGGDIKGIIKKIDYIKDLGVTALWITPIFKNDPNGYHGYWACDFYSVDPHFGTLEDFKELVQKAHGEGLKVILDIVVNHTGKTHPFLKEKSHWYHPLEPIKNWDDQKEVEEKCLGLLPDLNQDLPEVSSYLIDMCKWWVTETGLDGFRIDTVKHVPRKFWRKFCQELKGVKEDIILLGEVWHPDPCYLAPYQRDGINSLVDFPLYYAITKVFAKDEPMDKISSILVQDQLYQNPYILGTFIDNHDVPRFLSSVKDRGKERLKLALDFLFAVRGVPIIYYGTETGMDGGDDPHNRKDMDFAGDLKLREYVKDLISLRKKYLSLSRGSLRVLKVTDDGIVLIREREDEQIVVFINNSIHSQTFVLRLPDELQRKSWEIVWGKGSYQYSYEIACCTIPPKSSAFFKLNSSE
ncbi:alpha-amylase [Anaerobranca californiensis DSM 14826]|uniref:Alpha-amylase n=1 Tax=Anaerobranca californiensis DSM 14826 TaxID=1120989 RepID=A0A1M6MIS9_9FIRM|nr:alpha-amylase family glycosyl hydrolase [Anaerobranca californiensis]SHJ83347.1 alpha-amylase [Anaerobranca californiensis DSM 14826]